MPACVVQLLEVQVPHDQVLTRRALQPYAAEAKPKQATCQAHADNLSLKLMWCSHNTP